MKTIIIHGSSDDLIEVQVMGGDQPDWAEEFGGTLDSPYQGAFHIEAAGYVLAVNCFCSGAWSFSVASHHAASDYEHFPTWPITRTWGDCVRYSETLRIMVPDEVVIRWGTMLKYTDNGRDFSPKAQQEVFYPREKGK